MSDQTVVSGPPLVDADALSESFRRARAARRSELVGDYVELIADLIDEAGEARQIEIEIAHRVGVAQPTVAKMLKRLAGEGFVSERPYRGVFLTEAGRQLAETSRGRHQLVEAFLRDLGISGRRLAAMPRALNTASATRRWRRSEASLPTSSEGSWGENRPRS